MLSDHMFHRIRQLRDEGVSPTAISRKLGVDPRTVRKYLACNSPPKYKQRLVSTRKDPLKEFELMIRNLIEGHPNLTAREIFEHIQTHGYKGGERSVNRRVGKVRGEKPKERFFEQEYLPGEQAQFDFKEKVQIPFTDGVKTAHLHFGTLPYSDICFVHGYPFKNFECFIDGQHCFFEKVGGIPENIRIDNLSPCVKKVLKGDVRLYTEPFKRAIKHYGFGVLPCRPARGNEKGDVERDIRTYANRILNQIKLQGLVFKDWNHLNEWLDAYMSSRHTQEQKTRLKKEQSCLKPLPQREVEVMCRIEEGHASLHGTVRINKSIYSVPDTVIGVNCRTVMGPYEVQVFRIDGQYKHVATHPTKTEGESSVLLEHILPSLLRKPRALIRWAHRDLLFPDPVCNQFYVRMKKEDASGAEREFLRSINLIQYVPLSELIAGMELVLETPSVDLFEDLKSLLLGERRPAEVIDISSRLNQCPIQAELSQYDELIPNRKHQGE